MFWMREILVFQGKQQFDIHDLSSRLSLIIHKDATSVGRALNQWNTL